MDIEYARNVTFRGDVGIIVDTALDVIWCEGINSETTICFTMMEFTREKESK